MPPNLPALCGFLTKPVPCHRFSGDVSRHFLAGCPLTTVVGLSDDPIADRETVKRVLYSTEGYARGDLDAGIIITFDEMAYERWAGEAKAYKAARASFQRLVDFLRGDYAAVVSAPI